MRKTITLLLLLSLTVGCRHNVNTNNPQVVFAATIYDAAVAVDDFSLALRAANDGVEHLQVQEPGYYASIHPYLVSLAKTNDKAIAAIRAAKAGDTSADWRGALAAVAVQAGKTDPTIFGFKNPQSQATAR